MTAPYRTSEDSLRAEVERLTREVLTIIGRQLRERATDYWRDAAPDATRERGR